MSDLNPAPRLLMGPGPINADPRVLRAMSAQLLEAELHERCGRL